MSTTPSKPTSKASAEHHTEAASWSDKSAEEHRHAAKSWNAGDDKKAGEHAKLASEHNKKAHEHGKNAA